MPYVALGVLLLVVVLVGARWYANTPPQTILQVMKWAGIAFASLLGTYLAVTGRLGWALFAAPAFYPLLQRVRHAMRGSPSFSGMGGTGFGGGLGTGQTSEVRTRYIRMELDHDSGEMRGDVLAGGFAGRNLRSLSLGDLVALLGEAKDDPDSVQVLTAYLERYHGDEWRDYVDRAGSGSSSRAASPGGAMTRGEAYEILGLEPGADTAAIKAAHHRLMSKIHPDHGGSTYLAAKINQAKDLLLGS